MRDEMRKVNFKSVARLVQVRQQPHPDPELLSAGRGEGGGQEFPLSLKTVATIVKDSQDRFRDKCPMKW